MKLKTSPTLELLRLCCRILDDKKAGDLKVLDVSAQSSITDFLVLATATSEPHLRALRNDLEKALDLAQVRLVGVERTQESGWIVLDAFDVMVHLFLTQVRERYGLERLWRDAKEVPLATILPLSPPKRTAKRARKTPPSRAKVKRRKAS